MSTTRTLIRAAARSYAQESSGSPLLANDPADYNTCIDSAILEFNQDRPRRWITDYTVLASAFRFVLSGTGTILPTSGIQQWVAGFSRLVDVWWPYLATNRGAAPMDQNLWRVVDDVVGGIELQVLELLNATAGINDVVRVIYTGPHVIHETTAASTSIKAGDVDLFNLLVGAVVCEQAAIRYAQNTGTSALLGDTVDRRTQSDVMKSRAKDLRNRYNAAVGKGQGPDAAMIPPASAFKDIDTGTSHGLGSLWHPESNR